MTALRMARQGDRRRRPEEREYRKLTEAEIRALRRGDHVQVILLNGRVAWAKVNGAPRTWKRDPGRLELPMKYGFYEHFTADMEFARDRFVTEI